MEIAAWAERQWGTVALGDQRLNRRAVAVGKRLAEHPEGSLPQQMQSWRELIGAYRLLNNRKVTMDGLLKPHFKSTLDSAREARLVLWVEDTTEIDYTTHAATQGLGPIGNGKGRGYLVHSTIGVLPEPPQILGLGHVQALLRTARQRPQNPAERSAEARVWETSVQSIGRAPVGSLWVHVSDSGSDIFEYMLACRELDKHFLLRVWSNRRLTWNAHQPQADRQEARKIIDYARSLPAVAGSAYDLQVDATPQRPAHEAHMLLAWAEVSVPPPRRAIETTRQHAPLALWVLRAWEPDPPEGSARVEWILLCSLPIDSLASAREKLNWYARRWLCEDFHQCLKTGVKIEAAQLDHAADLQNLLGFAAPIAIRLLQLRQETRTLPDTLAHNVVDPLMLRVLAHRFQWDAQTLTLAQFWRGVAQLGGYLGRRADGPPGWRTLWHGWRYLSDLTQGARLILDSS